MLYLLHMCNISDMLIPNKSLFNNKQMKPRVAAVILTNIKAGMSQVCQHMVFCTSQSEWLLALLPMHVVTTVSNSIVVIIIASTIQCSVSQEKQTNVEYLSNYPIQNHNCFTAWSCFISHSICHVDGSCTSNGHYSVITQMHPPSHHYSSTYFTASNSLQPGQLIWIDNIMKAWLW